MAILLAKWAKRRKTAQVALAVQYLIVTLTVPLSHSCDPGKASSEHSNLSNSNYHCCGESSTSPAFDIAPKQNECESESLRSQICCAACLYSALSKSTHEKTEATVIGIDVSTSSQVLLRRRIIKHSEWFSSVSLRAPPISTS